MNKIKGGMRIYNGDVNELKGYQEITGHVIFDMKLGEGFRRKAQFVGDGHKTETPSSMTYTTVVPRDSVLDHTHDSSSQWTRNPRGRYRK